MVQINKSPLLHYKKELIEKGYAATVKKVSSCINESGIDTTSRFLLASEPVYVYLLHKVIFEEKVTDTQGVFHRLLANVEELRGKLYDNLIENVIQEKKLQVEDTYKSELLKRIVNINPPLDKSEKYVLRELEDVRRVGEVPHIVDEYLEDHHPEIYYDPLRKKAVAKSMVEKLVELGYEAGDQDDDKLFFAYSFAIRNTEGGQDPIRSIYSSDGSTSWDFTVDYFENLEEQGVDRENILAAGALYYIYVLGEELGIYRIADSIILSWTQGRLDIPQGLPATKAYRYYKLRDERTSQEERMMFYKQVLNIGQANMLDQMSVNTSFTMLWETFMTKVVEYIQKYENKDGLLNNVSKQPIYQATRDLQYNLSVATSGMVKAIIPEMYAHLQSAIDIIKEPSIVDQLGYGVQKSMWKVIERVSQQDLNMVPNISALRTSAIEGNKVFKWISDFDPAASTQEDFNTMIRSAEAFIISQSQVMENESMPPEQPSPSNGGINEMLEDEWDF